MYIIRLIKIPCAKRKQSGCFGMDLDAWAVWFPSLIHDDGSFCAIWPLLGLVFSLFFPFKTQECPCETVPSPWEPFKQDRRLPKDAAPGSGIPSPSRWPRAAVTISFHSPDQLRFAENTTASPRAGFRLQTPARMKWEAPLRIQGKAHRFPLPNASHNAFIC